MTPQTKPEPRALAGKHALVTGGATGIGKAVAMALLAQGARVTIMGRDEKRLLDAARELSANGDVAHVAGDVCDPRAVSAAFASAAEKLGRVDILVNNAGQAVSAPFLKTDHELWRRILSVNLDGTFHCMQAALPGMLAAGWGRIVNMASVAGLAGASYMTAYCASKHAVIGLTRAAAMEVATKGVTVNAVCPGYTQTEMVEKAIQNIVAKTGRTAEQALADLVAHNPQKRLVQPEEAASAAVWLCLPSSAAINGQAIAVAGGEVM